MPRTDHYAILLAINRYPGLTDLAGPENDAKSFQDWLLDPNGGDMDPSRIECIFSSNYPITNDPYDANPTDTQLKKVLNRWLKVPNDWQDKLGERLYLFFAGHGFAGGSILDPALYTAQAQMCDPLYIPGYRYASKIQNGGFFDEIILVMDCCQDVVKINRVEDPTWSPPDRQRSGDVKIMQAYGAPRGRSAFETPEGNGPVHGYFTSTFLKALRGAPQDAEGYVTARAVKDTFSILWNQQYLSETGYKPPIQFSDDIRIYRRGLPPLSISKLPGGQKDLIRKSFMSKAIPGFARAGQVLLGRRLASNERVDLGVDQALHTVTLEAEDSGARIRVFDGAGGRCGHGEGHLELSLSPGPYLAQFRLGDQSVDHSFEVKGADPLVLVKQGPLAFSSPIPLPDTSSSHEYHFYPAMELGAVEQAQIFPGGNASLLVFARDSKFKEHQAWVMSTDARSGLRLRSLSEREAEPQLLNCKVKVNPDAGISTMRVEVPSGTYLLGVSRSFRDHHFWQEMVVTVAPGRWRTEVYLDSVEDSFTGRRFDLEGASVLVVPRDKKSPLLSPETRLTEIARLGLAEGHQDGEEPSPALWRPELDCPMLALYQAYSLAFDPHPDLKRLRELCTYLRDCWTDRSGDVAILGRWIDHQDGDASSKGRPIVPIQEAPMMARGWDLSISMDSQGALFSVPVQLHVGMWRIGSPLWTMAQFPEGARPASRLEDSRPTAWLPKDEDGHIDFPQIVRALECPDPTLGSLQQELRRTLLDAVESSVLGAIEAVILPIQSKFEIKDPTLRSLQEALGKILKDAEDTGVLDTLESAFGSINLAFERSSPLVALFLQEVIKPSLLNEADAGVRGAIESALTSVQRSFDVDPGILAQVLLDMWRPKGNVLRIPASH